MLTHIAPQDILAAPVTMYANFRDNRGQSATLADFIRMGVKHRHDVEYYRQVPTANTDLRKYLKSRLPAAAISGVFDPTRKVENLKQHSGLLCIDIDHVDPDTIMRTLREIDVVAYASRSIGGQGVFAIIPIAYPDKHTGHFRALQQYFATLGIELDAQCKDVTRLRVISWDSTAFIRDSTAIFMGVYEEPKPVYTPRTYDYESNPDALRRNIETCISKAPCVGYNDWITIGRGLAGLGEEGRAYFHQISCIDPEKYDEVDAEEKFSNLLKTAKFTDIGIFFNKMRDLGVTFK